MYSLRGVWEITKNVAAISKITEMLMVRKTLRRFNLYENRSSKVSSLKITKRYVASHFFQKPGFLFFLLSIRYKDRQMIGTKFFGLNKSFCLLPLLKIYTMFLAISPVQILVIALVVLLLFGGRKIPELMKGLGTGIKEFKNATKEEEKDKTKKED